ncbi:hypothetical protein GH714_035150 [Hevea brasiliensis]|uniref:Cytochrome P450 n=1 Tax=Hevea brasiliensis TaxID=3981 RepID=A0A6A6MH34_HEVBR|nr:hypothetical protein GH714_035150 [Hevea brasiliensis]
MDDAIAARKENPSDDLLSRFMKKRDVDGNLFPISVLQRIALNFVLAGRDTSSVALSWFFWLVMNNPEVEAKIVKEISTVLEETRGNDHQKWLEEPLDFDEADKLVYLKAALAETLRLYPSVPQDFKYVVADDVLPDGTFVPAGSTVTYSIYSDLSGEGLGLPANEIGGCSCAITLPIISGSRPPCAAEDVSYVVHEEWASCILATSHAGIGRVSARALVGGFTGCKGNI